MVITKKTHKANQKITKTLVSFFVLAIFLLPVYVTTRWVRDIVSTRDPRKVVIAQPFQQRTADQTTSPLAPFQQPIVSVTFDDGWESVYTQAFPILQKNGIHTTQYIITNTFNNFDYMSVAQIQSLQKAGNDIGSHTVTHPNATQLSDNELNKELSSSKQTLVKEFGVPVQDFTSPYGAYNAHTLQVISQYYRSQKNAEGDPNANVLDTINLKGTFKQINIKSYSIRKSTTIDDIKKLVAAAQSNNGWLVLTYHQVDSSNENFSITPDEFNQHMQYLHTANIRSATVSQVLNALMPNPQGEY